MNKFDLLTIGLGPASYSCALYTTRYKLSTKMLGGQDGGQVFISGEIGNYLGFDLISGQELTAKMHAQVEQNGADISFDIIKEIIKTDDGFTAIGNSGEYQTRAILLATGLEHRHLGVAGEREMYGKGVTYCATCDGMFFRNQKVAVVGAGNSAAEAALYLAEICAEVHMFIRKPKGKMRADAILIDKLEAKDNVVLEYETEISEIKIADRLQEVILKNGKSRQITGLFVEIGAKPKNDLAKAFGCDLTDSGYVKVGADMQTNITGIFCAGDLSTASNNFAQIATAVGEGAVAAGGIKTYLNNLA